jgi:hypothetical protein
LAPAIYDVEAQGAVLAELAHIAHYADDFLILRRHRSSFRLTSRPVRH